MTDDFDGLRSVALPLDMRLLSEDFDPTIPPSSGAEYLQRVVLEASQCDQVVVASVDASKLKKQDFVSPLPGCERAPEIMIPSKEWQACQVADFSALRLKISRLKLKCSFPKIKLPDSSFENGWHKICVGDVNQDLCSTEEAEIKAIPPLVSHLLNPNMTQQAIENILVHNISWMEIGFSDNQAKWLYALLACLELPLTPSICSTLRSLARESSKIRATLKSPDHEFLAPLNLLICLVANYFQQTDLGD